MPKSAANGRRFRAEYREELKAKPPLIKRNPKKKKD